MLKTLDRYLTLPRAKTLTALSAEVGVSKGRLSQLRKEADWPPEVALRLEEATAGKVSASDICKVVAQARKPTRKSQTVTQQ